MKKFELIFVLLFMLHSSMGWGTMRGIPFIRIFTASDYNGHNQNYDVTCDRYGNVFVANFEGLLYYDQSSWRKIHTPGVSRVTRVAYDGRSRIWIGGYNVFGYLIADGQGRLQMKLLMMDSKNAHQAEVDGIKITSKGVYMHTIQGKIYFVDSNEKLQPVSRGAEQYFQNFASSINSFQLPDGVKVNTHSGDGLRLTMPDGSVTWLTDQDGLPTNSINFISYDKKHTVWGVTAKGIFSMETVTPYSHITESEGLKGEVNCINQLGDVIYIGTNEGLFVLREGRITGVPGINLTCWSLIPDGHQHLLASTSQGLYQVSAGGVRKISSGFTFATYVDAALGDYLTGETEGIFRITRSGMRTRLFDIGKVMRFIPQKDGLLLKTLYGTLWRVTSLSQNPQITCIRRQADAKEAKVVYRDALGRTWKTDAMGTNIRVVSQESRVVSQGSRVESRETCKVKGQPETRNQKRETCKVERQGSRGSQRLNLWLGPLRNKALNTIFVSREKNVIVGGDFGIIILDNSAMNALHIDKVQQPYIREIKAMEDSVLWGGFDPNSLKPVTSLPKISLPSSCRYVKVSFSIPSSSLIAPNMYRYRVNGGSWSAWQTDAFVEFKNLSYGSVHLQIQARDAFGRESDISSVKWSVAYPWYLQWWAQLFYLIVFIYFITIFFRWRERRLKREKEKLEGVVAERTSELATTLDDLKRTQDDLLRMERSATAGKLTQGLIDRILNPINYINNFSKLTKGLAKDLKEDIEDEKEHMSADNYDDCDDILQMMDQNLTKIEEHGVNTSRTLRAMEAMLNNHVGDLTLQDIVPLCKHVVMVTAEHFKEDVNRIGIDMHTDVPAEPVMVKMDVESMNRVLLSLLTNSVYAVVKKFGQHPYPHPEIFIRVKSQGSRVESQWFDKLTTDGVKGRETCKVKGQPETRNQKPETCKVESQGSRVEAQEEKHIVITIHDNGIGIEEGIKEKVFDPFFTTKTTGEAAGVGLYLVREIINDHHGTISLNSVKGEFCEFSIML